MFESNPENEVLAEKAFEIIKEHGIGVDIPTALIERAFCCRRYSEQWGNLRRLLAKFVRNRLKTHLVAMRQHTLRALTPEELRTWYAQKQWRKRWRSTSRQKFALNNSQTPNMSVHQRRLLAVQKEELAKERRALRQEKNAVTCAYKTPVNPLRKVSV